MSSMHHPTATSLAAGLAFGGAIAAVTGALSGLGHDDAWMAPVAIMALFVASVALLRALGRAAAHPRPDAAAALGAVGLAPVAFFAAWHQLDAPLGTASAIDPLEAAAAVLAFSLVAAAGWRLTARSCRASRAALALSLGTSALVATAGVTAALDRPPPTAYLANLEHVSSWRSDAALDGFEEYRPESGVAVGGTCVGSGCYAHVRRGATVQPVSVRFERGAALELVRDPNDDTLLLRANGSLLALLPAAGDEQVPNPAALADRLGPPPSFALLACIGLFGGIAALALRRRHERERTLLERARAGFVSEHGWLELAAREPPLRLDEPPDPGPVLVTHPTSSTPYRGAVASMPGLVAGTREALLERLDARTGALDALALSWVLVLAMPMAAALVRGLAP